MDEKSLEECLENCQTCASCCGLLVRPTIKDINLIADFLGVHFSEFVDRKSYGFTERMGLFLKQNSFGACIFLEGDYENGEFHCGVYDVRPIVCRSFPSSDSSRKYCLESNSKTLSK